MAGFIVYARGAAAATGEGSVTVEEVSARPVTRLVFRPLTPGRPVSLDTGGPAPDTVVVIDGATHEFSLEMRGRLPRARRLRDVAGADLRGQEVAVITAGRQRFVFVLGARATGTVMAALPAGTLVLAAEAAPEAAAAGLAEGTLILTPDGERAVETLRPGEMVLTADGSAVPLLWRASARAVADNTGPGRPLPAIRVAAGALGAAAPQRDLVVAAGHRLVLARDENLALFGAEKVLVPAGEVPLDGVAPLTAQAPVTYHHLLFERHETIIANGLEVESFQPGLGNLAALPPRVRASYRAALAGEMRRQLRARDDALHALSGPELEVLGEVAETALRSTAVAA